MPKTIHRKGQERIESRVYLRRKSIVVEGILSSVRGSLPHDYRNTADRKNPQLKRLCNLCGLFRHRPIHQF